MAMAMLAAGPPGALLICNGYKDAEYMQLVRPLSASRSVRAYATYVVYITSLIVHS